MRLEGECLVLFSYNYLSFHKSVRTERFVLSPSVVNTKLHDYVLADLVWEFLQLVLDA